MGIAANTKTALQRSLLAGSKPAHKLKNTFMISEKGPVTVIGITPICTMLRSFTVKKARFGSHFETVSTKKSFVSNLGKGTGREETSPILTYLAVI